jgi:hypothetical protein
MAATLEAAAGRVPSTSIEGGGWCIVRRGGGGSGGGSMDVVGGRAAARAVERMGGEGSR